MNYTKNEMKFRELITLSVLECFMLLLVPASVETWRFASPVNSHFHRHVFVLFFFNQPTNQICILWVEELSLILW